MGQAERSSRAAALGDVPVNQRGSHVEHAGLRRAEQAQHEPRLQCANVTRSVGNQLPEAVRCLLDGSDVANREGLTFLLLTTDADSWPQVAMLSVGELVAMDPRTLHVALWLHSGSATNLTQTGKATLVVVQGGNGYYLKVGARRGKDLDLGPDGRLAYFVLDVKDVQEDSTEYATLVSGITFKLKDPAQVVPRWQHTIEALRVESGGSNI
jgi:hypothetical protein